MRWLPFILMVSAAAMAHAGDLPHHELDVLLNPELHTLKAQDRVTLPSGAKREQEFLLHRELHPSSPDGTISAENMPQQGRLQKYRITLPPGQNKFTLNYSGTIFHTLQQDAREVRAFENTPGIIEAEGVVLTGESGWYPSFEDEMLTFKLNVKLPQGWRAVSQGKALEDQDAHSTWQEGQPQDEIYLIAAPFYEYQKRDDNITDMVYLRQENAPFAQRYLDATARYISMYQRLIGPYPYAKFALVENFWETGYGMPSFTLLGTQVIHLPFIIDTSYPHEILHNWWGNGVYVDYAAGNWSEGLTAYLADHLIQEQKGNGAEYRRSTLQKYTDFVSAGRDFPLAEFRSRHSEQSEALGYGKGLMLFHMLRRKLGDDVFIKALQDFYKKYLFHRASFSDLAQSFSESTGVNLQPMFEQWVARTGAPQLKLVSAETHHVGNGYELKVTVEQSQPGLPFHLDLPLAVTMAGQDDAASFVVEMQDRQAELQWQLPSQPLRVDVDPEFDIFRRLDRAEIPPALSQVFGAEKLLIVLPRNAPQESRTQYQEIAKAWQKQPARETVIKWDDELGQLPDTGAVWLFGWENSFLGEFKSALGKNASLSDDGAQFGGVEFKRAKDAVALTAHLGKASIAWLSAPEPAMLPILARKLPHYAKYSYAGFGGQEMNNLAKGMWPVTNSPLGIAVRQEDGSLVQTMRGKLVTRQSLVR